MSEPAEVRPAAVIPRAGENPLARVQLIETSLRCHALGAAGLVPVLGLPFAILALQESMRARYLALETWNPARRYLVLGRWFAWLGLLLTLLVAALVGRYLIEDFY